MIVRQVFKTRPSRRTAVGALVLGVLSISSTGDLPDPQWMVVGVRYGNRVLVPTNQLLDPAGLRVEIPERLLDLSLRPQGDLLAVRLPSNIRLYSTSGDFVRSFSVDASSFMGLAFTPDGQWVVSSQLGPAGNHSVVIANVSEGGGAAMSVPRNSLPAGLAFDRTGANLYVALNRLNTLGRLDIALGEVVETVPVGVAPVGVAITPLGDRLFVTNWGGRRAERGELQASSASAGTLVDERGVASSGTVSVVNVADFRVIAELPVGLHPSGIQISPDGGLAAVANSNSDSVTLIDTARLELLETISIPAFPKGFHGSTPTAVAFSPTGQWLYVTCGGNNAVAVLEREGPSYRLRGFVPTDWYPVALTVSRAAEGGETVYVANSKGLGSRGVAGLFRAHRTMGTLDIFPGETASVVESDSVSFTNDPFRNATFPPDSPQNLRSLGIQHAFLIIKENRTYDQVFGDLGRGNGDPSLTLYGQAVTPNQHALALQFVTLDNFYTSGNVSADGHQWLTQAMVTDYLERAFPSFPRSYPFDGTDPMAFASSGFLWNQAQGAGLTVRIFGEFTVPASSATRSWSELLRDAEAPVRQLSERSRSPVAALNPFIEPDYPAFRMDVPDVFRARIFLEKFAAFLREGNLPNLLILLLPTDHTAGNAPLAPTPAAMVADNDLAVGRIVEAITRSPVWPRSAIFITEDDAQDGVDHVDGHRTICLVVSPFSRRNVVDSTHYNQTSVLRTIEELLGMPPMNKFDASALPMRSVFVTQADTRTYTALANQIRLDALNPPLAALTGREREAARQSMAMDFSSPDAAPEALLNRILWHTARGWNVAYPGVRGNSREDD